MTIENKKGGPNWTLKRVRNTKTRPILIPKGQNDGSRDSRLPYTASGSFATHRWVPGSGE